MSPQSTPGPSPPASTPPAAAGEGEEQGRLEQAWRARLLADPSERSFREAYDAVHEAMRRRPGREALYIASLTRVDRAFLSALGPARRVLDVGAGNGRFALAAAPGRRIVAMEISSEAFAALRALAAGAPGPAACQASALRLPFRAGSFDAVVSQDLVEHLHPDHLAQHLAEVHRVLVPGGRYLLHTPSALHGPSSLGLHLREYRVCEVGRAARAAGFRPRWICLNLARLGWAGTAPAPSWPAVEAWEALWAAAGRAGLRRLGGRWYSAGVPDVDLDLLKPAA
jgi:SAM-dependent methyltransferase